MTEAYPLHWPSGWPRTPAHSRKCGQFKMTPDKARKELLQEINLLGGNYPLISNNVEIRRDGAPYANASRLKINDPGVAVYFEYNGKSMTFACDRYDATYKNMRAIGKTIEAIRGIERWGASDMMERALSAFEALPPPDGWRKVLGVNIAASREDVKKKYLDLAKTHHPDRGGDKVQFQRINEAYAAAMLEYK